MTVPGTMPTLIADLTCAANGSYTENYIRALCERAAEALQSLSQEAQGASELIAELEKLGIPANDWDGDDGLWPTLAKCIKNYCEEQAHYHAEGLKLDQEAVRDEALEEAAKLAEQDSLKDWGGGSTGSAVRTSINIASAIRALKREPNAAARVSAIEKSKVVRTCRKCKTSWEAPVNFCPQCGGVNDEMVDRFLSWPLPYSVCADLCATKQGPGRIGTNLLSATEAKQMLEYVLAHSYKTVPASAPGASDE